MDDNLTDLLKKLCGNRWQELITGLVNNHTAQQDAMIQHLQNIDANLQKLTTQFDAWWGLFKLEKYKQSKQKTCYQCHAPITDDNLFCSTECAAEYLKPRHQLQ